MRPILGSLLTFLIRLGLRLPDSVLLAFAGRRERVDRVPALDARFQAFSRLVALVSGTQTITLDAMRRRSLVGLAILDAPPRTAVTREDLKIDLPGRTLRARLYRPTGVRKSLPLLVYYHLGGCVIGSIETSETACSIFAEEGGVAVLSIDYRLAPEHRYPAANEDAADSYVWALENARTLNIDPSRVAVGGDSAGGYLAGSVCVQHRERHLPLPALQLLIYPVTNWVRLEHAEGLPEESYPLPRAVMDWFSRQYFGDADRAFETSSSLCHITTAVGLPPAIIAIAGHDILFQDGKSYAERLSADCVPTEVYTFSTLPHAFSIMAGAIPAARAAMNFLARRVGVRLGSL